MRNLTTLGDFVEFAENYKYSQEYFDIMQECYQVKLMDIAIDAYEKTKYKNVTNLMEAAEEDKIEEVKEKKKGLLQKIWDKIQWLWEKIVMIVNKFIANVKYFFAKIVNKKPDNILRRNYPSYQIMLQILLNELKEGKLDKDKINMYNDLFRSELQLVCDRYYEEVNRATDNRVGDYRILNNIEEIEKELINKFKRNPVQSSNASFNKEEHGIVKYNNDGIENTDRDGAHRVKISMNINNPISFHELLMRVMSNYNMEESMKNFVTDALVVALNNNINPLTYSTVGSVPMVSDITKSYEQLEDMVKLIISKIKDPGPSYNEDLLRALIRKGINKFKAYVDQILSSTIFRYNNSLADNPLNNGLLKELKGPDQLKIYKLFFTKDAFDKYDYLSPILNELLYLITVGLQAISIAIKKWNSIVVWYNALLKLGGGLPNILGNLFERIKRDGFIKIAM